MPSLRQILSELKQTARHILRQPYLQKNVGTQAIVLKQIVQ